MTVDDNPAATPAEAPASSDEFPILCETCLGPNPYVRMLKDEWGHACKVCERPFTSFRWRPAGDGMRAKKTEVCQTCARAKNVCQTCLLDLQYGLPVQVRDALLLTSAAENSKNGGNGTGSGVSASLVKKLNCNGKMIPQSDGVKEYTVVQTQRLIDSGVVDKLYDNNPSSDSANDQTDKAPQNSKALTVNQRLIEKLKKRSLGSSSSASAGASTSGGGIAKYNRNRVRVCSFFFKGKCKRGLYCPYRHELSENQQQQQEQQQNANATRRTDQSGTDGGNTVGNDNNNENDMVVDDLDKQNLRDRYYGVNDPVAKKIFHRTGMVLTPDGKLTAVPKRPANLSSSSKAGGSQVTSPPVAPLDRSIKSAFIGGVNMRVSEAQIRSIFTPGAVADSAIRQVTMRANRGFAFVEFESRQKAEVALQKCHGTHIVNGATKLIVNWGKGKKKREPQHDGGHAKPDLTSTKTNFAISTSADVPLSGFSTIHSSEGERAHGLSGE